MRHKYNKQITKNKNIFQTIYHAYDGIKDLLVEERNFRMHSCLALLCIIIALFLRISSISWIWLLLVIFFVLMAETINTIVENLTNLVVGRHYNVIAKRVKDIAAGGVMLSSFFAVIVMLIIFIPLIIKLL